VPDDVLPFRGDQYCHCPFECLVKILRNMFILFFDVSFFILSAFWELLDAVGDSGCDWYCVVFQLSGRRTFIEIRGAFSDFFKSLGVGITAFLYVAPDDCLC
jgi:hypothetical protein